MVTRIPSVLIKSAAKQVESAGKKLVQLTRGASSSSMLTDQSGRSSDANPRPATENHPLPAIGSGSGSGDDDSYVGMGDDTPDSSSHGDKPVKAHRGSHRRRKLFSSIFRRGRGSHSQSQSARELTSKSTC